MMSNDLKIIKTLEEQIGITIPLKKGALYSSKIGYRMTGTIRVTGLSLPMLELIDISSIERLEHLTELYLNNNQIVEIDALEHLKMLRVLWLNNNQINEISSISNLEFLQELWINDNVIQSISALKNLKSLVTLFLSNNKIYDISPLKDLRRLEVVDLRNNPIQKLPSWVLDQRNMDINWYHDKIYPDGMTLYNNPLTDPPVEIVQLGKEAIKAWFGSNIYKPINEAKILFVGNGGAGKTTIIKCLTGKMPNPVEDVTHQIEITSNMVMLDGYEIKLNYWDFGGQEVMHSTHQFFFSQRCLYVLVIDARHEENPEPWLRLIESLGGNSPILVVINKTDLNPTYDLDKDLLKEKYSFIAGFYQTSCTTSGVTGITDLYTGIANALKQTSFFCRKWPANWIAVKEFLSSMSEEFISQSRYSDLCKANKIYDSKVQDVLAEYLHDLGVIVYAKGLRLANMHILQPKWVSNAAYLIITSQELTNKQGVFQKDDLIKIMRKDEDQNFNYPIHTFDYILALMERFELCYALSDGKQFLIPDLLTIKRPKLPEHSGEIIRFVFEYERILPQSIITRFIVRMNNDIMDNLRWRTGVVIQLDIFDSMAIVMADMAERRIYISVSGEDRREYLSIIRRNFEEIHKSFQKLIVNERVYLSESTTTLVNYRELQGISNMNEKKYVSGELEKKFILNEIFEQIEPASKRTVSRTWDVFIVHSSYDKPVIFEIIKDLKKRDIKYWLDDEQIEPGNQTMIKIMDGLTKSNIIVPCISKNQLLSGWCQKEYTSILYRVINGMSDQIVAPLILDDIPDVQVPPFLSDLKYERYLNQARYKIFLDFLERKSRNN